MDNLGQSPPLVPLEGQKDVYFSSISDANVFTFGETLDYFHGVQLFASTAENSSGCTAFQTFHADIAIEKQSVPAIPPCPNGPMAQRPPMTK